jgi:hypothetical protein
MSSLASWRIPSPPSNLMTVHTSISVYLQGVYNKGTVLQESLHNLNIYHGWKNGVEYDDYSTAMGSGNSCPSAPELWRLGWATVLDQLNSSTFPAKVFKTYTLPATYLGADKAMIKVQPDWLSSASYTK